jgi:hypothetical protein
VCRVTMPQWVRRRPQNTSKPGQHGEGNAQVASEQRRRDSGADEAGDAHYPQRQRHPTDPESRDQLQVGAQVCMPGVGRSVLSHRLLRAGPIRARPRRAP